MTVLFIEMTGLFIEMTCSRSPPCWRSALRVGDRPSVLAIGPECRRMPIWRVGDRPPVLAIGPPCWRSGPCWRSAPDFRLKVSAPVKAAEPLLRKRAAGRWRQLPGRFVWSKYVSWFSHSYESEVPFRRNPVVLASRLALSETTWLGLLRQLSYGSMALGPSLRPG